MSGEIIQEVHVLDIVKYIARKNKKLQAILLQKLEETIDPRAEGYTDFRKLILDETSNFSRAIVRQVFGDIEVLIK
jgi:hypothetical protein